MYFKEDVIDPKKPDSDTKRPRLSVKYNIKTSPPPDKSGPNDNEIEQPKKRHTTYSDGPINSSSKIDKTPIKKSNTLTVPGQPPSSTEIEGFQTTFYKTNDVVNIPVKTYAKIRNSKMLRKNLEELVIDPTWKENPEKQPIIEEAGYLVALGEEIMKVLKQNNPKSPFIEELKSEMKDIAVKFEDHPDLKDEQQKEKDLKNLINWQKKLSKLEVKNPKIENKEKKQLGNIPRRPSFQELVLGVEEQQTITPEKIFEGKIPPKDLDEYVKKFLETYTVKMEKLDTPLSKVLAKESQDCRENLDVFSIARTPEEAVELTKLLAYSICTKFTPQEHQSPLMKASLENAEADNRVLEFNDLLRGINEVSRIPFKELDDMIQDPSTKFNLLKMRRDKFVKMGSEKYNDKESDLLLLNALEDDKPSVDMLIRTIAKDYLPPRTRKTVSDIDEKQLHESQFSDLQINFISLDRKEKHDPKATLVDSKMSFGSDLNFKSNTDPQEMSNIQKRINTMEANFIDSDEENSSIDEKSEISTPASPHGLIDYREDLADALDQIIDNINGCLGDLKLAREILKGHRKTKTLSQQKKLAILDRVAKLVEECNSLTKQGDKFKAPYEELKNFILENENLKGNSIPAIHNKGLIKMWGKYKKYIKKLKAENVLFIDEIQNSEFMKYENNRDKEPQLENIKTHLEAIQAAIAEDDDQEEKENAKKLQEPKRLSILEIKKQEEEDTKKQKEMDKKIENLSESIEEFKRASINRASTPGSRRSVRKSVSRPSTVFFKTQGSDTISQSMIATMIDQDRAEDENQVNFDALEMIDDDESEGADNEARFETEKSLMMLKSQSLAAMAAIEADEESEEETKKLLQLLHSNAMQPIIKCVQMESYLEAFKQALEEPERDDQKIREIIEAIYEKIKHTKFTEEEVQHIYKELESEEEGIEDELEDEIAPGHETIKARQKRERCEEDVKNIRDIVDQLKRQLCELDSRSENLKTLGPVKLHKLSSLKAGIDKSLECLKEEPMPKPTCFGEMKRITRTATNLLPKNEELTSESVVEIEEIEDLSKAINKNTDQLSVNMADVGEYNIVRSGQDFYNTARSKKVNLKETSKEGSAPKNSDKLTDEDKKELRRYLSKLNEAIDNGSEIVTEW